MSLLLFHNISQMYDDVTNSHNYCYIAGKGCEARDDQLTVYERDPSICRVIYIYIIYIIVCI